MKRTTRFYASLLAPLMVWAALAGPTSALGVNGATADLKDAQGTTVGSATFTPGASGGVKIQVTLNGFTAAAGEHGIHIHAVGKCDAPDFKSAGGHFNPTNMKHGLNNPVGPHAGDLPNLVLNPDGATTYQATDERVSLDPSAPNTLLDADGSALVVHAGPDDLMTDPAGNSGSRIACGVLVAAQAPVGMPRTGAGGFDGSLWLYVGALALFTGFLAVRLRRRSA